MKLLGIFIETAATRRKHIATHAKVIAELTREYNRAYADLELANTMAVPREGKGESTRQRDAKMRLHNAEVALQRAEEAAGK